MPPTAELPGAGLNLADDPWIAARFMDGTAADISIRDTFHRAHEIREIAGEVPTQSFAILRLLLAILYRAPGGEAITTQDWQIWQRSGLPLDEIDDYLDAFRDRFELLDPERPFFQVVDLATAKGERKDVAALISDLPSNNRLFTNRAGEGADDLSLAEAARWLVNVQAFDVSGIKSGALGDPRVKGGKGYPIGLAWSGLLGGVYAQGATLRDTLLLNLVGHEVLNAFPESDLPPWEEPVSDSAAEREGLLPRGPVRLYTWQSRRVRLFEEGGRIVGCLVANGDRLTPQNRQILEPMSAWRFSEPQTKVAKQTTYMPREHQPGRALWRGVAALLPTVAPIVPKRDVVSSLPPALIDWLEMLDEKGLLDPAMRVRLRAVGVVYGSNNSVVDEILDDQVLLPIALLRERNRVLAAQAEAAVRLADEGAYAVRRLAENLERAAGGTGEASRDAAIESAYAALDRPYRDWLGSLDDATDPLEAITSWKDSARTTLRRVGGALIAQAGPAAWAGREVSRNGQTELITTPRAEGWFLRALTKTFGKPKEREAAS